MARCVRCSKMCLSFCSNTEYMIIFFLIFRDNMRLFSMLLNLNFFNLVNLSWLWLSAEKKGKKPVYLFWRAWLIDTDYVIHESTMCPCFMLSVFENLIPCFFLWMRFLVTSLFSWMLVNWLDYVFVGPKINAAKTVRLKQKVLNSSLLAFDYFYSILTETMTLGDHSNGSDLRKMSALWSRFGAWNPLCRAQQPFVNVWPTLFSKGLVFDF